MVLVHVRGKFPVGRSRSSVEHLGVHTLLSAYAAYISGILINVVGFAGASESPFLTHCDAPGKRTNTIDDAGRTSPCYQLVVRCRLQLHECTSSRSSQDSGFRRSCIMC